MRPLPPIVALIALAALPASPGVGQDIDLRTTEERLEAERYAVDRGPLDHLGWGTLEDLHVDLGAGAAVSVFSGNLVLSVRPFVRADAVPDSQLGLTYNHKDSAGGRELAPGWTHDLGRYWAPGAWGDRVLVDADGFRDSFFVGEPPDPDEVADTIDELVRAWRRDTPRREQRQVGGPAAMRSMLGADPLFLAEMRLRYLGPAAAPEPETGEDLVWTSPGRGQRRMIATDDGVLLERSDGGTEQYSIEGHLVRVDVPGARTIELRRDSVGLSSVVVGRNERYQVLRDSMSRLRTVRGPGASTTEFDYAGSQLWRIAGPAGEWRFTYDAAGRLTSADGPDGRVVALYDASGRLLEASGPRGEVTLGELDGIDVATVEVEVDGETMTCSWDPAGRQREITGAGWSQRVLFEPARPLPTQVEQDGRVLQLEWHASGRLTSASRGNLSTTWERDAAGRATAIVDTAGSRGSVDRAGSAAALVGWTDPEGRRTDVRLDAAGRPESVVHPAGLEESAWRTADGLLRSVATTGGESLELRRDGRGFLRTVESVTSGDAGFSVDARGRVQRFEPPGGRTVDLGRTADRLDSADDRRERIDLTVDGSGRILRGGALTIEREPDGRAVGVDAPIGPWSARRDDRGRVTELELGGLPSRTIDRDAAGRVTGWSTDHGTRVELDRDRDGRTAGVTSAAWGSFELELDDAGRAVSVSRGSGRWAIDRDSTGRPTGLTAGGASFRLTLDRAGRPDRVSGPRGFAWTLLRDPVGRLQELRSDRGSWQLRRARNGEPREFSDPVKRIVELRWDRGSRWSRIELPGGALEADWNAWGPVESAGARFQLGPAGSLDGWGPQDELGYWTLARDDVGRVSGVEWRAPSGRTARRHSPPARDLERDSAGRPLVVGPWRARWTHALDGLSYGDPDAPGGVGWELRRDGAGRVRELTGPDGATVEVFRDPAGDVRELAIGPDGPSWSFVRDSMSRVGSVVLPDGRTWTLDRDPLGRVERWRVADRWTATFEPLDGTGSGGDDSLAQALGVETDDVRPDAGRPSGSRQLRVELAGGGTLLEVDELRSNTGAHAGSEGFWGSNAEPELDESPLVQPIDLPSPTVDDPIAAELGAPGAALAWGPAVLGTPDGMNWLPAPDGRGAGASASGWLRLAAGAGGTVAWLGPDAELTGLRLPRPGGRWSTPDGWLGYPAPPGALDPAAPGAEPAPPGDPGGVWAWWTGLGLAESDLARLPAGVVIGPAWRAPRLALGAADALLPPEDAEAGIGSSLPTVPGADLLVPGPPGAPRVTPLEALILGGDLPTSADLHRGFVALPPAAWQIEVPGADLLRAIAERRARPALPPGSREVAIIGLSPGLDGFATSEPGLAPRGTLQVAADGLPPGVQDLRPGLCDALPGAAATRPSETRCSALEALSDDPLVPGAAGRAAVEHDSLLLALQALDPPELPRSLAWLAGPRPVERWVFESASGTRVVVDGRARLVSLDAGGRLRRAAGRRASAWAGRALLLVERGADPEPPPVLPRYAPEPSTVPESRWGLAPAEPRLPLTALGEPALPLLRAASGLPPADLPHAWPPLR